MGVQDKIAIIMGKGTKIARSFYGGESEMTVFREFSAGLGTGYLRVCKGMSTRQLSKASGVSNSNISRIENDKVSPTISTYLKLLDALGCDLQVKERRETAATVDDGGTDNL